MKDWKIALISAIWLAAVQMFLIISNGIISNGFPDDFLSLVLFIMFAVPLIIALLSIVLLLRNKKASSFLSLVFSFLNFIFIVILMSLPLFAKTAVMEIIAFELMPSILLIIASHRSYQRLRKKEKD